VSFSMKVVASVYEHILECPWLVIADNSTSNGTMVCIIYGCRTSSG
jgi:hypothetical protein